MTDQIYLDNSCAARTSDRALQAALPYLSERWYAPQSPYPAAQSVGKQMQQALARIYRALGVSERGNLIVTSSGAEAICQIVHSVHQQVTRRNGHNHFVVGATDEAPTLMSVSRLEAQGVVLKRAATQANGQVTVRQIADAITPRTALVSLNWADGLTGLVHAIAPIADLCRQRGILLHVDVTHLFGRVFLDLAEAGPDYVTLNGGQQHGLAGSGLLYAREGAPLEPLISSGQEQAAYRGGYPLLPQLAGLAEALEESRDCLDLMATEVARLRDRLVDQVMAEFHGARLLFGMQERLPHVATIVFHGISGEALLYSISKRGVMASIGGGSMQQLARNLMSCHIPEADAWSAVSFSLSRYTTEHEIDRASEIIAEEAVRLRQLSLEVV